MSGPDAADSTTAPAALNTHANDIVPGAFVAPRTYLEPTRPVVRPMTAIDREQMEGLVELTSKHRAKRAGLTYLPCRAKYAPS